MINSIKLRQEMTTGKEELLSNFRDGEIDAYTLTHSLSDLVDKNVTKLADEHFGAFKDHITLVYTGSNGRQEVCPYSDLDVFLLVDDQFSDLETLPEMHPEFADALAAFYRDLDDARFNGRISIWNADDRAKGVKDDQETWTQTIDRRKGWGSDNLYANMNERLAKIGHDHRVAYIQAKFDEYGKRLNKQDTENHSTVEGGVNLGRFTVIEPNVKDGYGGLRGYQTAQWVLNELKGADGCSLVGCGVITPEDEKAVENAHNFLLTIRCHLHDLTKREVDNLESHYQPELSSRMGYNDVTLFMKDYFRATREISHYARMVCSEIAEQVGVRPPGITSEEQVRFRSDEISNPIQILNLFKEHAETGNAIHHTAMQKVRESGGLITSEFIQDSENNRIMLDILSHEEAERTLRRMNTLAFLPRFIPELEKIRALIQFNPYHAYTVDDHTLVAIGNVTALARQEHAGLSSFASRIAQDLTQEDREILSVALLLHDVHKGDQPENLKSYNRGLVKKVGARLGLEDENLETAAWLAENHLLLKHTSRYGDIENSEVIKHFVSKVPDIKHLELLRVMTLADTLALGPGRLKHHSVFRADSVYEKARNIMSGLTLQYNRESYVLPEDYKGGVPYVSIVPNNEVKADILTVVTKDKPYLLENMMSKLEDSSTSVLNARVRTIPDGSECAANIFVIQNSRGSMHSKEEIDKIRKAITEAVEEDERIKVEPISAQQAPEKNPKNHVFPVEPNVEFSNELSDVFTTVEITARNRPHLLHGLAAVFNDKNISIQHASITSEGNRAVNVFQIHRDGGQVSREDQTTLHTALMKQINEQSALNAC